MQILENNLNNLKFKIDNYKCATLDLNIEENFTFFNSEKESEKSIQKISKITKEFQEQKLKAIWLIVPSKHSHLIHHFTKNEYKFHHVEENDILCLYKWLLNTPCNLPNYASRYLGVGGLILNKDGQILLVKERRTISKKLDEMWKIPTGLAENGESIQQAVIREVKEETGLDIKFQGVLAFREAFPYLFNASDLFFVCLCKCEFDQTINIEDGGELKGCRWFDKDEIKQNIKEKKFSMFSINLFTSILDLLPDGLNKYLMQPGEPYNFLKSKFTIYSPKW